MRSSTTAFRSFAIAALSIAVLWATFAHATELPGLRATAESLPWPHLAARVGFQTGSSTLSPALRPDSAVTAGIEPGASPLQALNVLGDVYFSARSRFRATGGVLLGMRAMPWPSAAPAAGAGVALSVGRHVSLAAADAPADSGDTAGTVPYFGVGYSDGSYRGHWGISADVGLLALTPQPAVRLGRVFTGQQGFEDLVRELRLTPSVQIGVSYAF